MYPTAVPGEGFTLFTGDTCFLGTLRVLTIMYFLLLYDILQHRNIVYTLYAIAFLQIDDLMTMMMTMMMVTMLTTPVMVVMADDSSAWQRKPRAAQQAAEHTALYHPPPNLAKKAIKYQEKPKACTQTLKQKR